MNIHKPWPIWVLPTMAIAAFFLLYMDTSSCGCGRKADAQVAAAKADITAMKTALEQYEIDNLAYPTQNQGLAALVANPGNAPGWAHPYIEMVPKDPWGHAYIYRVPGQSGADYDLFSAGPDGIPGTMDDVKP